MGVNLHVDLETLQLIQGPGQRSAVSSLRFKRGDSARLQVAFLQNGVTPVTIGDPAHLEIQIGIKPRNQFDRSYLAHSADWSMPSEGDDEPTYECALSLNTLQLNAALNIESPTSEELSEITLMGEITWREGTGEPTSTRTFLVVVENDVNRGTEGVPQSAEPAYPAAGTIEVITNKGVANGYAPLDADGKVPATHLPGGILIDPTITTLTGTGTNALAAIATTTLPLDRVLGVVVGGTLSFYLLTDGTDTNAGPGIVHPNDYNWEANPRVWKQIL
jgi:hypothetical protein